MNPNPLISVVVPTYHRNDLLAKCLDLLTPGAQSLPAKEYEVIVTDDGSQITAEQMIVESYSWARWVAGPKKGPAANRNNGAKVALGEWLAFLDDDCLPDTKWLKSYAEAIATHSEYPVFEGRVYVDRPKQSLAEVAPIFETGGYLPSGNFLCRKDIFDSLGGFDERFPYAAMEDVDFRKRLLKAGHQFLFIREASVCHPWRRNRGWRSLNQQQESTFIYLSIHPEEESRINSRYYLKSALRGLVKSTIPEGLRYRGAGIKEALMEHCSSLKMAFLLAVNFNPYKKHNS